MLQGPAPRRAPIPPLTYENQADTDLE